MSEWQYEGFERPKLTLEDIDKVLKMIRARITNHFEKYGDGVFMHPHEVVGCMYGQQMKLSASADDSIYHGDLRDFEERCRKSLLAIIMGTASVQKMSELRGSDEPVDISETLETVKSKTIQELSVTDEPDTELEPEPEPMKRSLVVELPVVEKRLPIR